VNIIVKIPKFLLIGIRQDALIVENKQVLPSSINKNNDSRTTWIVYFISKYRPRYGRR
jgi:hypothetical protein